MASTYTFKMNDNIKSCLNTTKDEASVIQYINTLNDMEFKALNIAIEHLKTSFDIEKSIDYLKWKKNQ